MTTAPTAGSGSTSSSRACERTARPRTSGHGSQRQQVLRPGPFEGSRDGRALRQRREQHHRRAASLRADNDDATRWPGDEPRELVAGKSGWSWVPQNANALLDDFEFRPFTYRNQTLPQAAITRRRHPGLGARARRRRHHAVGRQLRAGLGAPGMGQAGSGRHEPVRAHRGRGAFSFSGGWASSVQAGARGGNDVRVTTSGAATYTARYVWVSPIMEADDFSDGVVTLEIWARALVTSTLVNPRLRASPRGSTPAAACSAPGHTARVRLDGAAARQAVIGHGLPHDAAGVRHHRRDHNAAVSGTLPGIAIDITGTVEASSTGSVRLRLHHGSPRRGGGRSARPASPHRLSPRFSRPASAALTSSRSACCGPVGDWSSFRHSRRRETTGLGGALIEPSAGRNRWLTSSSPAPSRMTRPSTRQPRTLAQSATVSLTSPPGRSC
jgi:hypothetical protein